jgi:hypothetical protein
MDLAKIAVNDVQYFSFLLRSVMKGMWSATAELCIAADSQARDIPNLK